MLSTFIVRSLQQLFVTIGVPLGQSYWRPGTIFWNKVYWWILLYYCKRGELVYHAFCINILHISFWLLRMQPIIMFFLWSFQNVVLTITFACIDKITCTSQWGSGWVWSQSPIRNINEWTCIMGCIRYSIYTACCW